MSYNAVSSNIYGIFRNDFDDTSKQGTLYRNFLPKISKTAAMEYGNI